MRKIEIIYMIFLGSHFPGIALTGTQMVQLTVEFYK